MKANELTIGDWVRSPKNADGDFYAGQVCEIMQGVEHYYCNIPGPDGNDSIRCDDLSPVPLTVEILEKNGFECRGGLWNLPGEDMGFKQLAATFAIYPYYADPTIHLCEIMFVHELQHALRLCGIEKEIVL